MCLYIPGRNADKKKWKPQTVPVKAIWVYKLVKLNIAGDELVTPFQGISVSSGWLEADKPKHCTAQKYYANASTVGKYAIHAYKSNKTAKNVAWCNWAEERVILKCRAYPSDFVAHDRIEVCYTRIFCTHDEYLRGLAEAKALREQLYFDVDGLPLTRNVTT